MGRWAGKGGGSTRVKFLILLDWLRKEGPVVVIAKSCVKWGKGEGVLCPMFRTDQQILHSESWLTMNYVYINSLLCTQWHWRCKDQSTPPPSTLYIQIKLGQYICTLDQSNCGYTCIRSTKNYNRSKMRLLNFIS